MRTISTVYPKDKFIIENIGRDYCDVVFFSDVIVLENGIYEYELTRIQVRYRKGLREIIEGNYDLWLAHAKKLHEKDNTDVEISVVNEEYLEQIEQIFLMEHRLMQLEMRNKSNMLKSTGNYEKSPYGHAKLLIENRRLDHSTMLSMLDDFVNNLYLTIEEYEELYDMLDIAYNSL